jgi:hypothetical protein
MLYNGPPCICMCNCYTDCPRTASPEKKGSIWVNVIIWILKKKSPISNYNWEKTKLPKLDKRELGTIEVEDDRNFALPEFRILLRYLLLFFSNTWGRASGIGEIENFMWATGKFIWSLFCCRHMLIFSVFYEEAVLVQAVRKSS